MARIDLHTHSTCSDGTLTPIELARHAYEVGLSAVALTDHDRTSGIAEFSAECERLGIEPVSGIEFSAKSEREIHIVCLYASGTEFDETVKRLHNSRMERNVRMIDRLNYLGLEITLDDVIGDAESVTYESCGRVHIAQALVRRGYAKDIDDAFMKYVGKGKCGYVDRFQLTPEECIGVGKRGGGVAIWAHPALAFDNENDMLEMALRLKSAGLDAMECLYSSYSDRDEAMCRRVADKAGLLISGGSDFHGENKIGVRLGEVHGGHVDYDILRKLKERINI